MSDLRSTAKRVIDAWERLGRCEDEFSPDQSEACGEYRDALDDALGLLRTEVQKEPSSSLTVFFIDMQPDGNLRVQIASATEMSFTMQVWPGDVAKGKHDQMMVDLCTLAPAMMNVDAAMMEMMDGGDAKPAENDLQIVLTFIKRWRYRIVDSNVGFSGWPGNVE